jgi:hypothetical protein
MQVLDLVQFDPTLNCFVLKGDMQNYPPKWPDGTPKSTNNVFSWRTGAASIAAPAKTLPARAKDLNSNGSIYAYTPASKTTYGQTKKFDDLNAKI